MDGCTEVQLYRVGILCWLFLLAQFCCYCMPGSDAPTNNICWNHLAAFLNWNSVVKIHWLFLIKDTTFDCYALGNKQTKKPQNTKARRTRLKYNTVICKEETQRVGLWRMASAQGGHHTWFGRCLPISSETIWVNSTQLFTWGRSKRIKKAGSPLLGLPPVQMV